MSKLVIIVVVLILVAIAGYMYLGNKPQGSVQEIMTQTEMVEETQAPAETITLLEQNESSQSGTATLVEENGKVKVTIMMNGAPSEVDQPAHIHVGACPEVGEVAYPLTNIKNGTSETLLDTTLSEIAMKQPLGINVHKSVEEAKIYIACGDLNLQKPQSQ